ncbi:MAG: AAA family ATPase [Erysipelotrichia bacterium]|jgi:tRNA uridine 5-carbamoylmethylation protein Kti12|nr:AAA family ATPase [Bacilli bacterium]NLB49539.1 AAA family ATPase [Erysipelotrichia bacterium]
MAKLIVLSGIPGSGKSYLCSLMKKIKKSHVYIISSDALRNQITGDQADLSKDNIMWRMFYELPKIYSSDPEALVLLDATHALIKYRTDAIKHLIPLFDEVSLVMFNLEKKIVDNQNVEREHPVSQSILDYFYQTFEGVSEKDKEFFAHIYVIKNKDELACLIDRI